jgi:hypothetical protein
VGVSSTSSGAIFGTAQWHQFIAVGVLVLPFMVGFLHLNRRWQELDTKNHDNSLVILVALPIIRTGKRHGTDVFLRVVFATILRHCICAYEYHFQL